MDTPKSFSSDPRAIHIFVSSTFVDMQQERDELGKFTFPLLRKLCEQRDVTLVDVDFRWGITDEDEQKDEGKVLKICLEKIRDCNTFIGLLGERYGTIARFSDKLIENEPWLNNHKQDSFTELEILKGVLNIPRLAEHSFFYFRDPEYINILPKDQQSRYREDTDPQDTKVVGDPETTKPPQTPFEKLVSLKKRIQASGITVRQNYRDPRQLGEWVQRDLTEVIDRLFPEDSLPNQLDREAAEQNRYLSKLMQIYETNRSYINLLDSYVREQESSPIIVFGESGIGKSALLANWGKEYQKKHPDDYLLIHVIGITPQNDPLSSMLFRILGELKRKFNLPDELPESPADLRAAFHKWLHVAGLRGRIVLILDGIDQISTSSGIPDLSWLPYGLPATVHLIMSVRGNQLPNEFTKRNYPTLLIRPLDVSEREGLIKKYLNVYSKELKGEQVGTIGRFPQCGLPVYLRILLEELRLFGSHEGLTNKLETYLQAENAEQLCSLVLDRFEQDYERDHKGLVQNAVSLILVARQGLKEPELLELLGRAGNPLPYAHWVYLSLALEPYLQNRNGSLAFPDGHFRLAAGKRYLATPEIKRSVHVRLGDYFSKQELSPRKLAELPWQLAQAEEWQALYDLLSEPRFLQAAWANNPYDVRNLWSLIEIHTNLRMLDAFNNLQLPPLDGSSQNSKEDDLHWLVATLLYEAGKYEQAIPIYSIRADYLEKINNIAYLDNTLNYLGLCYFGLGRFDQALVLFRKLEKYSFSINDGAGFTNSIINQANILDIQGFHAEALSMYSKVEELCRINGNDYGLQVVLGNLAGILMEQGDLSGALQHLEERDQLCRKLADWESLLAIFLNKAEVLDKLGRTDDALKLLKEHESYCRKAGNPALLQKGLVHQAALLHQHGDLKSALDLLDEAERICSQLEYRFDHQEILEKKALIFLDQNATRAALDLLKKQEEICRELGDEKALQGCLGVQASAYSQSEDQETALILLKEQERICRKIDHPDGLQRSLGDQANILFQRHDLAGSLALHEEEEKICRQLNNIEAMQKALGNKGVVLLALGRPQEAMKLFKEKEKICRQICFVSGLTSALANQALVWVKFSHTPQLARPLVDEALQLAKEAGLVERLQQLQPLLTFIREHSN